LIRAAALAVEGISIESAGGSQGACGQSPQSTGYHRDFLLIQITSAPPNQYSVLVIHFFLSLIGSVERAQTRQEKSSQRQLLLIRAAALAVESISVRTGVSPSRCGTKSCGTYSATDVLDFLLAQGTSASAKQYSVLVIHILSPLSLAHCWLSLSRSCLAALKRSQTRLAADFTNVLISIRRRSGGAKGKSNKPSVDHLGFCRCQFTSTAANQYSVLAIHIFSFHCSGPFIGPKSLTELPCCPVWQ
jgi:hypothetical protein